MSMGATAFAMRIFDLLIARSRRTETLEHLIRKDGPEEQSCKLIIEGVVFSDAFLLLLPQIMQIFVIAINKNCDMVPDGESLA
jgi:hypothetical protein